MSEVTIIAKSNPDYRTWMYIRKDGEMLSQIVTAEKAEELYEDGWRMTPAEFTEDESLIDSPEFNAAADEMAVIMNTLLNIDEITDHKVLVDFAERFLDMKITTLINTKTLRKRINTKAKKLGLFE